MGISPASGITTFCQWVYSSRGPQGSSYRVLRLFNYDVKAGAVYQPMRKISSNGRCYVTARSIKIDSSRLRFSE